MNTSTSDKEVMPGSGLAALVGIALRDIVDGARYYRLWLALAKEDVLDAYRHTSIGVLWAVFSFSFYTVSIVLVFGLGTSFPNKLYIAHLVTGLLAWNFISPIVNQGVTVFTSQVSYIKGSKLPLSLFTYHIMARNLILDGFAALGGIGFLIWSGYPSSWVALAALPAIGFFIVTAIPVQLLLGSLGAYTRDVKQIIENVMRSVFFLTPVIWTAAPGTHREVIARYNPFTSYIEIFRIPILEGRVPWENWLECLVMTGSIWIAAVLVFAATRRHIVFWL
ncbi:ABC transporter permease [Phyllobacterium sp. CCNWLW109]|uniref:ABC transporter permease n=1 Tax=Phyllobacterium sp. CCNWLW109 TaxID=3127479 RepID=UPI003077872D